MSELSPILENILEAYNGDYGDRSARPPCVSAIMGPNGCGKSRFLLALNQELLKKDLRVLLIPATRGLPYGADINLGISIAGETLEEFGSSVMGEIAPERPNSRDVMSYRKGQALPKITDAIYWLISIAQRIDGKRKERQAAALYDWHELGAPKPDRLPPGEVSRLEEKIQQVLGYNVTIAPGKTDGTFITFKNGDTSFSVNDLSSGEKQTLLISALSINNNKEKVVILVDEPELHLNEALAITFWERLEAALPKCVFLYATHSPNFATRSSVQDTYIMRMDGSLDVIDKSLPVRRDVLREIVGARVQLSRDEGRPIFCEDKLAKWILTDLFPPPAYSHVPLINCKTVIDATKKVGGWQSFRGEEPCCGVIDRDARDEHQVSRLQKQGLFILPRYESEAILLEPKIALWSLRPCEHNLSEEEYKTILVACAEDILEDMKRKIIDHYRNHERLTIAVLESDEVRIEIPENLGSRIRERFSDLRSAIVSVDIDKILTLFKSKYLYNKLKTRLNGRVQIEAPFDRYMSIRQRHDFQQVLMSVEWVSSFRARVENHFSN